uniref:Uncharacterized protein AlNc14C363G11021 n=1 Tax=Albugo laibachii Nc14 TaxID=890382 RepID=F0WXT4_9STRA|nr:conserved hypothetical protein [Albugo laibachii Nc14]|eukprot:CCA26282.1 conserved hypothetical protein [Albugo laibachii Nc14]
MRERFLALVTDWIKAYVNALLYFPKLIIYLNWNWNPLCLVPRILLTRMLKIGTNRSLEDTSGSILRWLDPGEKNGEHIAIVSYPRSGNTLMRGLLEQVTGTYTGCDTHPDRVLSRELQKFGMEGEGVVDDSVWFIKSHYPERLGWKSYKIKKAIVVIRNPWDAIDSYFNMTLTNSHTKSIHESQYERFADRWDGMLRNEIDVWMAFHRFWTQKVDIPVIIVRYEDLMLHRAEMLRRVFCFITDTSSLQETEWESKVDQVASNFSTSTSGAYAPRSGKIGASFKHYSKDQFDYILNTARIPLRGFGYDPETQDFPASIRLPKRQVKLARIANSELLISIDSKMEIRKKGDTYGRHASKYRKALLDPVICNDGTELNVEEVTEARKKAQKAAHELSPNL